MVSSGITSPTLSPPEAAGVTVVCVLNGLFILGSTLERTFVARRQQSGSSFRSTRSLLCIHPRIFNCLWIVRGTLGISACLLPLPAMWLEVVNPHGGDNTSAVAWATSALVACVASSIAGERVIYLSFTDSLNLLQVSCTVASVASIVLLVLSEPFTHLPLSLAWAVSGCALHRSSMVAWWYAITHKIFSSGRYRDRARYTLAGHGLALACVFLALLPVLRDGFNPLYWLSSVFLLIELVTVAQAARMTCSNLVADRDRRRRGTLHALPRVVTQTRALEVSLSDMLREGEEAALAEPKPVKKRDGKSRYEAGDEVDLATMVLKRNQGGDNK